MRMRLTSLVAATLLGFGFAGCSSGSDQTVGLVAADCAAGDLTFCLTACNLGCTINGGCSLNAIAQNQRIELFFSESVDPSSVNNASISLKTANGEAPTGTFEVEGAKITFIPEARLIGGVTTFGFRSGEEYVLTLPGGRDEVASVRSKSGDRLARTVACSLLVDRGLVDLNNRAPSATLVSPLPGTRDVPPDQTIVVEFDELVDVSAFQGSSTSSTPIRYLLRRTNPDTGEPDEAFTPVLVPGVPNAEAVLGQNPTTRITLQPLIELPTSVCIEVIVTEQVRDISGTPAAPATFRFYTSTGIATPRTVSESFIDAGKFDTSVSSVQWGGGSVTPGTLGGDGKFGDFDVTALPQNAAGEFVWNTDQAVSFSPTTTLLGLQDEVSVDGVASFARFTLDESQTLRFEGSKPPVISVSGLAQIDGVIKVNGRDAQMEGNDPGQFSSPAGGAGGLSGPGGGNGGRGADGFLPGVPPVVLDPTPLNFAEDGSAPTAPAGSGYAGGVAGLGGSGGTLWPEDGMDPPQYLHTTVNTSVANFYSSQQASGGGGGGYLTPGQPGAIAVSLVNPPVPADFPDEVAPGGGSLTFSLPPAGVDAMDHFLVGGGGGGGGGSVSTLVRPTILSPTWMRWIHAFGGGGGGGAIGFRFGSGVTSGPNSLIDASGGSTHSSLSNTFSSRGTHIGGGGAGGAVVIQVDGSANMQGTIDVSGGQGGVYTCSAPGGAAGDSRGGAGSPGYVRIEANGATPSDLGTVLPVGLVGPDNAGALSTVQPRSVGRSTWYPLNSLLAPRLRFFELTVTVDGNTVVYTDNPASPNLPNVPGSPVEFYLQGSDLDVVELQPAEEPGPWVTTTGEMQFIQPTGFRFVIFLDTTNATSISVDNFVLHYET